MKNIKKLLPKRKKTSHKGDFGKLLILAGSRRMVGCSVLAVEAALRCGTGLLTLGFPKGLYSTYTRRLTESMFLPLPQTKKGSLSKRGTKKVKKFLKSQDVLALGPGLSRDKETQSLVQTSLKKISKPFLLDADGLFPFSGKAQALRKIKAPFIVTPHAGEFKRLFKIEAGKKSSERELAAKKGAWLCGGVVVLKGDRTVVADPSGKIYVNKTGNAGLAKGGTGDVLFGMIAAFLAQGLKAFDAACLGVYVHGLAADLAVEKIPMTSLLASDVIEQIPEAMKRITQ